MKILMRAAKNPMQSVGPVETIRNDTVGQNSGNLLFAAGAHALLSTIENQVDTVPSLDGRRAGRMASERYDGVVLPFANCFRGGFEKELLRTAEFIEALDVPFAMLSGGAQVEYGDESFAALRKIEDTAKRFCRAVLSKSSKITVRGNHTAKYIRSLGFSEVEVIGCPSLTRPGYEHAVSTEASNFGHRIAYNIETRKDLMGAVLERLRVSGANLEYIAQDMATLEMFVWSREMFERKRDTRQPLHLDHTDIRSGNGLFFLDASTWIAHMRNYDMAFGPRIHGAISAISAGTPALLVAHDLRTRELAEYHEIPCIVPSDLNEIASAKDLWSRINYSRFNQARKHQVEVVVRHLENNGFTTSLSVGAEADRMEYFDRLSCIEFHPVVRPRNSSADSDLIAELRRKDVQMGKQIQAILSRLDQLRDQVH